MFDVNMLQYVMIEGVHRQNQRQRIKKHLQELLFIRRVSSSPVVSCYLSLAPCAMQCRECEGTWNQGSVTKGDWILQPIVPIHSMYLYGTCTIMYQDLAPNSPKCGTNSLLLNMAIYSWFTHKTWWFPIVMLVYQRVSMPYCRSICCRPIFPPFPGPWMLRLSL